MQPSQASRLPLHGHTQRIADEIFMPSQAASCDQNSLHKCTLTVYCVSLYQALLYSIQRDLGCLLFDWLLSVCLAAASHSFLALQCFSTPPHCDTPYQSAASTLSQLCSAQRRNQATHHHLRLPPPLHLPRPSLPRLCWMWARSSGRFCC